VGPLVVVVVLVCLQCAFRVREIEKVVLREALTSDGVVKALNVRIVRGVARSAEVETRGGSQEQLALRGV
jgi:hypothetical protein